MDFAVFEHFVWNICDDVTELNKIYNNRLVSSFYTFNVEFWHIIILNAFLFFKYYFKFEFE